VPAVRRASETESQTDLASSPTTLKERTWDVVAWDDPVTPMKVVVVIFKRVFGYSDNKATQLMLEVHHRGRSVVWSGTRSRAERYCAQLQAAGLVASVEEGT
jgi:ATP-dependent Clp protease adaptor protein ClpS